jgi:hypothetical protein
MTLSFLIHPRVWLTWLAVAVVTLAGCGGGGTVASNGGVGSGGTGSGVVSGFGSLIVDGVRRADSAASYTSEEDQGSAGAVSSTDAHLGQSVDFSYDAGGNLTHVLIAPSLVGPVSALAADGITVNGMSVKVNTDARLGPVTSYIGYGSLADIQVGDRVAVHGTLLNDAGGNLYLQASLIVLKPATATGVRLTGYVAQYGDGTAGTFALGNYTVTVGGATLLPSGASLADGELVTVWSNSAPVGTAVSANVIRVRKITASGNVTVAGGIANLAGSQFSIRNVNIESTGASITPAGATLSNGEYAVVSGTFDATTNLLTATTIILTTPAAPRSVELHGAIGDFVSLANFTVRGTLVDASGASFAGGVASDLQDGVFVEIHGSVSNGTVIASSVDIQAKTPNQAPPGASLEVTGTVGSYTPASGVYSLNLPSGATLSGVLAAQVFYRNGVAANFATGTVVRVSGVYANGVLTTSTVVYLGVPVVTPGDHEQGHRGLSGRVSHITNTSFMVNGLTIQKNGVAGADQLQAGQQVQVDVTQSGGQWLALALHQETD